jgi:molybdate-binding protein/DNA-binding XRE family transcriptional regulator
LDATRLLNSVATTRVARGFTQQDLAARVGLSRQALSAIETGHSIPSTALALRLAEALGHRVEELFRFEDGTQSVEAELADPGSSARDGARVAVASVFGKRVAVVLPADSPLSQAVAADGVLESVTEPATRGTVRLLTDASMLDRTLVAAGCAPALGILTARANADFGSRILWLEATSTAALDLLRDGLVHVAGAHLFDEPTGQYNVPFVERLMPDRSLSVVELGRWEVGLVVPKGNPRGVHSVVDLVRLHLRMVQRDAGAGAQQLLERLLAQAAIPKSELVTADATAESHLDVARAVALGIADAGIAIVGAARALDLGFVPLGAERFDLVFDDRLRGDPRLERLMNTLTGAAFSTELASIGGYDLSDAGRIVARTAPT